MMLLVNKYVVFRRVCIVWITGLWCWVNFDTFSVKMATLYRRYFIVVKSFAHRRFCEGPNLWENLQAVKMNFVAITDFIVRFDYKRSHECVRNPLSMQIEPNIILLSFSICKRSHGNLRYLPTIFFFFK